MKKAIVLAAVLAAFPCFLKAEGLPDPLEEAYKQTKEEMKARIRKPIQELADLAGKEIQITFFHPEGEKKLAGTLKLEKVSVLYQLCGDDIDHATECHTASPEFYNFKVTTAICEFQLITPQNPSIRYSAKLHLWFSENWAQLNIESFDLRSLDERYSYSLNETRFLLTWQKTLEEGLDFTFVDQDQSMTASPEPKKPVVRAKVVIEENRKSIQSNQRSEK